MGFTFYLTTIKPILPLAITCYITINFSVQFNFISSVITVMPHGYVAYC